MSELPLREVYLQPGDFCFGENRLRITTVLGSCISIILWHPTLAHGGMCHFMLPTAHQPSLNLNGKYADDAFELFMGELKKRHTVPAHYRVSLYGGGKMFETEKSAQDIGSQNIDKARQLLRQFAFKVDDEHVGDFGRRRIAFDVWSGAVRMTHVDHRN
jgi:chemotaxis protein CheD